MLLTINTSGQVLDLFTVDTPERGVTEVAVELGMSKSKAHSLLASLTEIGLLQRTDQGRYRVGWRVLGLNRVLADTTEFRCHARPVMETLSAHFGETVHLGTLDDGQVMYVDRIQGTRAVQIAVSAIGSRLPAHCSAVGKALLATLSEQHLLAVVTARGLPAMTRKTITDIDSLRFQLTEIPLRGYALDLEEVLPEISCVAAPIMGRSGKGVAAISIAAPTYRFEAHFEAYRSAVVKGAQYVSRQLRATEHIRSQQRTSVAA